MTREHNWADNYKFSAVRIHRPASIDEVRRLVARSPRTALSGRATRSTASPTRRASLSTCATSIRAF
jgi:hypothetical protein